MPGLGLGVGLGLMTRADKFPAYVVENAGPVFLWLKGDSLLSEGWGNGLPIATWTDSSGNGRDAVQNAFNSRPVLQTAPFANLHFDGVDDMMFLPSLSILATGATAFVVFKKTVPGDLGGVIAPSGEGPGSQSHIPYVDGVYYDKFGSSVRQTTSTSAADPWSNYIIYEVCAKPGFWENKVNGQTIFTTNSNTLFWREYTNLGVGLTDLTTSTGSQLTGNIAEVIIFEGSLSVVGGNDTRNYLANKYNITLYPPLTPPLAANIQVWLKPEKIIGADGAPLATWQDSSGKGNHATQNASGTPATVRRVAGRYPHLSAGGFTYLASPIPAGGNKTLFIVGKFEVGATGTSRLFNFAADANAVGNGFASIYLDNGDGLSYYTGFGNGKVAPGASNWNIITVRFVAGTYAIVYVNGIRWMEGNIMGMDTHAALFLFASTTNQEGSKSSIAEVLLYDVSLGEADCRATEVYLSQKHSIAVNHINLPLLPSDAGTLNMFFEADAILPADQDGSTVTTWRDQSGRNCHLSQATFAAKPTVLNAAVNGYKSVYLDGTDDCMLAVDDLFRGSHLGANYTIFVVHKKAQNGLRLLSWQNQVGGDFHIYGFNGTQYLTSQTGGGIEAGIEDNLWQIGTITYKESTTQGLKVYHDGVLRGTGNTDNFPGVAALQLGCYIPGNQSYKGEIAAIIVYRNVLSDSARQTIEASLGAKYGIQMPGFVPGLYGTVTRWHRGEWFLANNYPTGIPSSVWADESSVPIHASSPTASRYPLVNWNIHNGKAGMFFDGVDDILNLGAMNFTSETWFMVIKPTVDGTAQLDYTTMMITENNRMVAKLPVTSKWGSYAATLGDINGDIILPANTAQILAITTTIGQTKLYRNGTLVTTFAKEPLGLAVNGAIGSDPTAGRPYKGYIMQIVCYSGVLSDTNRRAVFTELGKKYNIPITNS